MAMAMALAMALARAMAMAMALANLMTDSTNSLIEIVREELNDLWSELPNQGHYQCNYDRANLKAHQALNTLSLRIKELESRALPEWPSDWVLNALEQKRLSWHCQIDHIEEDQCYFGEGPTPREAVLNTIAKIPLPPAVKNEEE